MSPTSCAAFDGARRASVYADEALRKRLSIKTRRPGTTVAEFRAHYEGRHVPMGLAHARHFGWRRYVRNYVVGDIEAGAGDAWFDCVTEFWVDDAADDAALQRFVSSPAFAPLNEDDGRFLDVSKRLSFDVRSTLLQARAGVSGRDRKWMLLWRAASGDLTEAAQRAFGALGDRVACAILDRAVTDVPAWAGFDTLLSLWIADDRPVGVPSGILPDPMIVAIDPVETLPEVLDAHRARSPRLYPEPAA